LSSLAQLYVRGVKVNWLGFDKNYNHHKVVLPTYPFQRERYWLETSEHDSQTKVYSDSATENTEIVQWLNQGNTQQLRQHIQKVGKFSPEQAKLLPEFLEILVKQHQEQVTTATVKDWLYHVQWKSGTDIKAPTQIQPAHWLIFADTTAIGEKLAQQLQQHQCEYSLVYREAEYKQLNESVYQLNPKEPQEFKRLIKTVIHKSNLPLLKVIHLWSLDIPRTEDLTLSTLKLVQLWGCGSVLHLMQALIKENLAVSPRFWLITRGVKQIELQKDTLSVAQAPIWGLSKVIAQEHPQLWGGIVDLELSAPIEEIDMLLARIENSSTEDNFAFRKGQSYVPRLKKRVVNQSKQIILQEDRTYLITGGWGILGLNVAEWMVKRGARHLMLTSRREPSDNTWIKIRQLEQQGVKVHLLPADVSKLESVVRILEDIKLSLPPLGGIIHTAGVTDDSILQQTSYESLQSVMAPKVFGSWNLHALTKNIPLDFFVCFSSVASLLGSAGQGNYAAANAFMDSLVHYRQEIGLPGLSINWSPWAEAGMVKNLDDYYQNRLLETGITPLTTKQGLLILERLMKESLPQVGVLPVEWSIFSDRFNSYRFIPLLSELIGETEIKPNQLLKRLESVLESDRQNVLITHVQTEVTKVLGLHSDELFDPDVGFAEMGLDSLMAIEIKNQLQSDFQTSLPVTLAIEYPTIEKLSKYLAEEVMGWRLSNNSETDMSKISDKQANSNNLSEIESLGKDDLQTSIDQTLEHRFSNRKAGLI